MKKRMGLLLVLALMMLASTALAACPTEESHRYGSWKTKTKATCTRQGHQFKYCQNCDHWEQRWTAKLPHTPGEMTVTKEPTCTAKGRQEAICQECGKLVAYNIDKLPHNDGEMKVIKEPTCTANGTAEYTCLDCGRVKKEAIERLGHDLASERVVKEPTCNAVGTGEEACLRCSWTRKTKIDKLEHVFGDWSVTREPQGKRKGIRESVCTLCGKAQEEYFFYEGTLYEGMTACPEVITLQEQLRDLGFYRGAIRSGQYGDLTTQAVARFQKSVSLEESGVADPQTIQAIEAAWEKATGKQAARSEDKKDAETVETLDIAEMEGATLAQMIIE